MKNPNETSQERIKDFHKEIRKIKREIKTLQHTLETGDMNVGYWSESSLYAPPAEKKKKSDSRKSELDFVVPWQMR
ncbi:MAG TPA: hypothetical protein VE870_11155 [Bacteroidales bacterium]|nr:hypothetical protein [Bacteroidales bacterium]